MHRTPRDLECWRVRHLQLAALARTIPLKQMHMNLADFYLERIAALMRPPAEAAVLTVETTAQP